MALLRRCSVVLAGVLLAACGGGDDGAAPATTTIPPPTTVAPTTVPVTTVPPTTAAPTTLAPTTTAPDEVTCTELTYPSSGMTIPGERCIPTAPATAPRPAAIVLHGCDGYADDDEITGDIVRALAGKGIVALRIDYMAAKPAPRGTYCDPIAVVGAAQPLLQAIDDGVAALRTDPGVDPTRIGAAAHSLGSLASLATHLGGGGVAQVPPASFAAAALLSYPNLLPSVLDAARTGGVPPLLLITGDIDTITPTAHAQALADAATAGGVPVDFRIWPGQDHPFRGAASDQAATDIADYLAQQLAASS